jgi:hypothetical protein
MWYSPERGKLEGTSLDFTRLLSCTEQEFSSAINEIIIKKVADVTRCNGDCNAVVTVINRRMTREESERESTRYRVKRFRNAAVKRECNASSNGNVTVSSSSSSSIKEKYLKKSNPCNADVTPQKNRITFDYQTASFLNVPTGLQEQWRLAYPAVDVLSELQRAAQWAAANPKNRKANWQRFIVNWLAKAQEKSRPGGNGNVRPYQAGLQRGISSDDPEIEAAKTYLRESSNRRRQAELAAANPAGDVSRPDHGDSP